MNILVVGGGGREHAIIKKLRENQSIKTIYALPGNGGIAVDAVCVPIGAKDIDAIVKFATENAIDFAVVAPDDPLALGCVDHLEEKGIPCFGPNQKAAEIESSKIFAKNLMKKYGIPTASFAVFENLEDALTYIDTAPIPLVVKADGLALGKGVVIASTRDEAKAAVKSMMTDKIFGESGSRVVLEEFLTGPEVSVLSFTDGKTVVPMVSSMDHKRALDFDAGMNTGGMGTVAPNPFYTPEIASLCMETIFRPTIDAMNAEGRPFKGCLYFGLMLTKDGPKVIEYNCRFGDPETQVVLPLMESDLLTVMQAVSSGKLSETEVKFANRHACCVIMASKGYPGKYEKDLPLTIPADVAPSVYVAGAKSENGKLLSSGGRVLGVTAVADSLAGAVDAAYEKVEKITFEGGFFRRDIGQRALRGDSRVSRLYVEKKAGLDHEARALLSDLRALPGLETLTGMRILNRYDVENISEDQFIRSIDTVFSEPQLDIVYPVLPAADHIFAVEYLPGQFDQRADSASQCIQLQSMQDRPTVRSAKVYLPQGNLTDAQIETIKKYIINPVESREAALPLPKTLTMQLDIPTEVAVLDGFLDLDTEGLEKFLSDYQLAMDLEDLTFCQNYFKTENRCPTLTEIRMIDTYWSDHCRHTTFLTTVDEVIFEDETLKAAYQAYLDTRKELGRTKPINFMDIATLAGKYLKSQGKLDRLDESEEINACTVKMKVTIDGKEEDWLLLFKNETHNHPTEIEPFGGAATCIGGAIRDPLSGRAYVYAAMRVTGAADPLTPPEKTLPGKLPQKKIVTTAAAGYSSYGNQIGLATGQVDEIYHPGYAAKRMEIGAVIGAVPAKNVCRLSPEAGDVVILIGGRTGRDGCGGATGSSKSHTASSLESCGAEVQKGNAPEERKLQRLFRNGAASKMIKRCNDFGAGGVSVAIGELADGLEINLNAVPKKYEGLDGTELAISESQERMAVLVAPTDKEAIIRFANEENLEATHVATVTASPRLVMHWNGKTIVDISREFLNSNGAEKHITVTPAKPESFEKEIPANFADGMKALVTDLNVCSKRGLSERFDSTIGAGTVLMPFGGKYQQTPSQAMVHKISLEHGQTDNCSFMAYGYNPFIAEKSPYHGAYLAVVESLSKIIAAGGNREDMYLTFQEYFEKPKKDGKRWGKPLAALLGGFMAQKDFSVAAIGGKDSMSGTFETLDVPPTLVSFAVSLGDAKKVVSGEFKEANHPVYLLKPTYTADGLPEVASLEKNFATVSAAIRGGKAKAVWSVGFGGVAEGLYKMAIGNRIGVSVSDSLILADLFSYAYGSFIIETDGSEIDGAALIGKTTDSFAVNYKQETLSLADLQAMYEEKLERIFPCNIAQKQDNITAYHFDATERKGPAVQFARPRVLIPVFPGTNCEYDTARAMERAGAEAKIFVLRNLTAAQVAESAEAFAKEIEKSQIVFIPGGFSGGDEPDGSGKFITAFFRAPRVTDAVHNLLKKRDGLMAGICNGFQALIKLGLVPFGEITTPDQNTPTLTYNTIGRHQSRIVYTRIASNLSPWLMHTKPGEVYAVPISHGEGRFLCDENWVANLAANGQIATQYVDLAGNPTAEISFNPNNAVSAIEGITSPDGRVFGKMGHAERFDSDLYRNVPGNFDLGMFSSAVKYFKD